MPTYYDKIASSYDELHGEEQLRKLMIIKSQLKLKKTDKVLDVGCGTGLSRILGCRLTGIDPSTRLLKKAGIKTIKATAEKLPFKNNSFDAVICVTSIHNFEDAEKAIKEMKRVSTGSIVISVLRKSASFNRIRRLIEENLKIENEIGEEKDVIFVCR